ncbi:MAG: hypothetical protein EPO55_20330 [Reyranella sp.]|uniref:hypothetical protein n=1 Tax=Reyranella sp. TaxID=1929291 RepID=UPI0012242FA4|nr:hypothetical protein [Reyranella sp.]TAJ36875.1 MAG: hypothetical protein EPO55_20330 [Reyranella sp.]
MNSKATKVHFTLLANGSRAGKATTFSKSALPVAATPMSRLVPGSVGGELAAIKAQLNVIDKFVLNRGVRQELGRVLHDAYMQLAEAKRQELLYRITLDLDSTKKQLFVANLEASRVIDKEIAEGSAEFTKDMLDGALAVAIHAATEKHHKLGEIDELLASAKIDEESHAELREATIEAMRHLSDTVKDCVSRILVSHMAKVQQTLELFRERGLTAKDF